MLMMIVESASGSSLSGRTHVGPSGSGGGRDTRRRQLRGSNEWASPVACLESILSLTTRKRGSSCSGQVWELRPDKLRTGGDSENGAEEK